MNISLRQGLNSILDNYTKARLSENFGGHILGSLIRTQLPEYIKKTLNLEEVAFKLTGSIGKGNWAKVPWLSIMHRSITETTQKGIYIVYLFSEDMKSVYLTLNQGVTEPQNKHGRKKGLDWLRDNAEEVRSILDIQNFNIDDQIHITDSGLGNEYQQSTIAYKKYDKGNLPDEQILIKDLTELLNYYQLYIEMNSSNPDENIITSSEGFNYTVANLYLLHGTINYLKNKNGVSKQELIDRHQDILKGGEAKHPKDRVMHLTRLAQDLGLVVINNEYISLTSMGKEYASSFDEDIWHVTTYQRDLLKKFIEENKLLNPTIRAIIKAVKIASQLQNFELEDFISPFTASLEKGNWSEVTRKDKSKFILNWLVELKEITKEGNLYTFNGRIFGELPGEEITMKEEIERIHEFIQAKGFTYSQNQINNLYLSLKAKPFVIFAGISGTGKTKLIELFAESVGATRDNGRFVLIPVRPDWSDGSDLLGYETINGEFRLGPLTKVLIEANKVENRNVPFFVCLDEMNLARVEHYFSDFLSVIESRKKQQDSIVTGSVLSHSTLGQIAIPDNLFVIGTVNMDETTHPFSKKVLDRANTIEFNEVYLDNFPAGNPLNATSRNHWDNSYLKSNYVIMQDVYFKHEQFIRNIVERLSSINIILTRGHFHVGYRVRDEVVFYMVYNEEYQLLDNNLAFDYQILQKILPRIQGSTMSIKRLLVDLFNYLAETNFSYEQDDLVDEMKKYVETEKEYPQSLKKITYMVERFDEDGFTSFWIS